jgi:hypothetical protein
MPTDAPNNKWVREQLNQDKNQRCADTNKDTDNMLLWLMPPYAISCRAVCLLLESCLKGADVAPEQCNRKPTRGRAAPFSQSFARAGPRPF